MSSEAETLLQRFGIDHPSQIDLEAIAYELGALVVYRKLDGCDARIVGHGTKAIVAISENSNLERKRFSIGHEIGHWRGDWRGSGFLCGKDDIRDSSPLGDIKRDSEARANRFAADLILPNYLFAPACARRPLTVETAISLSGEFRASITSCAIRLIQRGSFPGMVVCYSREKREWFVPSEGLPDTLFPLQELHQDTNAFDLLYTNGWGKTAISDNSGTLWINRRDASKIRIKTQSIKITKDRVLSVLGFIQMN